MNKNTLKLCSIIAVNLLFLLLLPVFSLAVEIEAVTKPSADIELSFVAPGKIKSLLVKEGNIVKKGSLLARLEDDVESIQHEILSSRAKNTNQIDTARAELAQKEKDLQKMASALKDGAVTDWEVEHAKHAVNIARLALQSAQFEHELDARKQQEIKAVLDQLHLFSPINGTVEEINIETGESIQALSTVMRVVNIDPLLLDVAVPVAQAKKLSANNKVDINSPDGNKSEGYIENISSVADAAATTLRVRVKVSNPDNRPAGQRVSVNFGE